MTKFAKRKTAGVGNAGTEEFEQLKAMTYTRAETRAQADALFDSDAKKMRQADNALMGKLFVQAPAAVTMAPNLQKTAHVDAFFAEAAKGDDAQRRYPELLKVAASCGGDPRRPSVNLKPRKATSSEGPDAVKSDLSGGAA
jgi:hypothetical protein